MIAALYGPDGGIVQVVVGSRDMVLATAENAALEWAEWVGTTDFAVTDALDETHHVIDGHIIKKDVSGA